MSLHMYSPIISRNFSKHWPFLWDIRSGTKITKTLYGLVLSNLIKILSSKTSLMHKHRRVTWLTELLKIAVDGGCNWKWGITMKSTTKSGMDLARYTYRYDRTVTSRLCPGIYRVRILQNYHRNILHHLTLRKIREEMCIPGSTT